MNQQEQPPSSRTVPPYLKIFRKGQPLALGMVLMMSGVTIVVLGSLLLSIYIEYVSITAHTKTPTWVGTLFIISGSMAAAAQHKGPRGNVVSSLVMSVFTTLVAAGGIIVFTLDVFSTAQVGCITPGFYCTMYKDAFIIVYKGILGYLLALSVLAFCISISNIVFASKAVCCKSSSTDAAQFVVQNAYSAQAPGMQVTQDTSGSFGEPKEHGMQMAPGFPAIPNGQGAAVFSPTPYSYSTPAEGKWP
ncbi:membrane-spanning 4-domains subfamily A member 4A-like [Lissotriton helveticus]